jgi:hypothetical protein
MTPVQARGKLLAAAVALQLAFGPSLPCDAPPGTVVARMLIGGGDGNPISYTMSGDTQDFRIRGSVVVVGLGGINRAHCGSNRTISVTATQQ